MTAPQVSIALPIHRADAHLGPALDSITRQTLRDIEILIILNGSDRATRDTVHKHAASDPRIRIIELPDANLAGALNVALEAARAPLVARMDADDLCPPERVALQARRMSEQPSLAALGCAWDIISPEARVLATVRPPTDPAEARWRLLLGNPFAHGSMMLRREDVLAAGGYDTRCTRAQDFDLWLRLSRRADMAALPNVLYQHRTRTPEDHSGSSSDQSPFAASALVAAWTGLPPGDDRAIAALLAAALERGDRPGAALDGLEVMLRSAPTRGALLAWLYTQWANPPAPRRAVEVCRLSRLREVGVTLRASGVASAWLWGAGDHTRWVLDHRHALGVNVTGIVDDSLAGQERFGLLIQPPSALPPGDTAILSSDWHEEAMWHSSAPHRARGVRIVQLYAGSPSEL